MDKIKVPNMVWGILLTAVAMLIQYQWPDLFYAQVAVFVIVGVAKAYNITVVTKQTSNKNVFTPEVIADNPPEDFTKVRSSPPRISPPQTTIVYTTVEKPTSFWKRMLVD